ncbi:MAG: DUF4115 domain-containing protein [Deltaproteobacteria bacterium]|nr:DUF4115 domain-containing protein [Deltaproteobacteria bacterium]
MGQDHQPPKNAETDEWVFSSGISPGALLKREREKRGLSYAEISQQTRLRAHLLVAIENEEWDLLPAPTLVKGFIRSYARVLGLDEERILELYREETGSDDFTQKFVLPSIPQRKKWPFVVVGLLVLMAAVSAFYVWFLPPMEPDGSAHTNAVSNQSSAVGETPAQPEEQRKTQDEPLIEEEVPIEKEVPSAASPEVTPDTSGVNPETRITPETAENRAAKPPESPYADEEKPEAEIPSDVVKPEVLVLRLKGHVTERTWLRISIDGAKPKEYVFSPSDTPEWEAEKGFELLIGNAGGIALEFNGKKMDNLGKQGQVVRIKLPEEEERSSATN